MELRNFSERRPVLAALGAIALGTILTELPLARLLEAAWGPVYSDYGAGIIEQGLATLLALGLMAACGLAQPLAWSRAPGGAYGLGRPPRPRLWLLAWPLLVFALLNASDSLGGQLAYQLFSPLALVLVLLYLSTGFIEEVLFRGLAFGLLARAWAKKGRRGVMEAVLVSSFFFCLLHLANFAMGRSSPLSAATQVVYTFFFGVFFCALYIRTSSLWPGIVLHAVVDFAANLPSLVPGALPKHQVYLTTTPLAAVVSIGLCLPLLVCGLFYLRKSRLEGLVKDVPETPVEVAQPGAAVVADNAPRP